MGRGAGSWTAGTLARVVALVLGSGQAQAQGGPPLLTDDPFTPRAWHWELNTAWSVEHGPDGTTHEVPALDLNYGWGPKVQLKLEGPYRWVSTPEAAHDGWGNLLAGVKYRFADRFHGWALSTYPQVELPVSRRHADRIGGDSVWAFLLPLEAAHSRRRFEFDTELGYRTGAPEVREVMYGVVLGWLAGEKLELLAECNGQGARPLAPDELTCGPGVREDLTDHLGAMAAVEPVVAGSDPDRPKYHLFLGLQTHIRGGGFWRGARRALIGK